VTVWAVGDVQGCLEPLDTLLQRIAFDPARDQLWFCGDLVNRGPDSLGVLARVRELGPAAIVVLGNHDLHWLATHFHIRDSSTRASANWLRRQALAHYDASLDCLMVHAGVYPGWNLEQTLARAAEVEEALGSEGCEAFLGNMYGDAPNYWSDDLDGIRRLRAIVNALTRMRMVDEQGRMDFAFKRPPGKQPPYLAPWFTRPSNLPPKSRTVFGHWSALGQFVTDRLVSLDSGCVWGRSLTAVRLDGHPDTVRAPCPKLRRSRSAKRA